MKILVFFGSARRKGETRAMVDAFSAAVGDDAEIEIIDSYRTDVRPCIDCRHCWTHRACAIKDGMQAIYEKIDAADGYVIASPLYFHSVPGKLKVLFDRLQVYWAGVLRGDKPVAKTKRGAMLLTGGSVSFKDQFLGAEIVGNGVISDLSAVPVGTVRFTDTDHRKVSEDETVQREIQSLAANMLGQA